MIFKAVQNVLFKLNLTEFKIVKLIINFKKDLNKFWRVKLGASYIWRRAIYLKLHKIRLKYDSLTKF